MAGENVMGRMMAAGLLVALLALPAAAAEPEYRAEVIRTAYGAPHIIARDYGGLGYGGGYSSAEDNFCDFADLANDIGKAAKKMFARIKNLHFFSVQRGPCAGRRIGAANHVVNKINMVGPLYMRFAGTAPAFVTGFRLVLHCLSVFAGIDQVCRFQHGLDTHREQFIEVNLADGLVGTDIAGLLQDHRTFVEPLIGTEYRQAGVGIAADDRPVDR
jgi:hypothetical protein